MHVRPPSVPIFILVGALVWLVVTVAAVVSVIQAPAENAGLGIGIALLWVALLVFAGVERWTGGRGRSIRR